MPTPSRQPSLSALVLTLVLALVLAAALAGCAAPGRHPPPVADATRISPMNDAAWQAVPLPGKTATRYGWGQKEGRPALAAVSKSSASMYRQQLRRSPQEIGEVSFSWWVRDLIDGASVAHAEREDAPARVMFGFSGDVGSLPSRTRALFDLAEAVTGQRPPYATLMYVWDAQAPVGSVIVNPRSDRIRKIVVDSGPAGLQRWRDHRRDLAADFRLAFGEAPGTLVSVAVMTDSDNTRTSASSWYGPVHLYEPSLRVTEPRGN